jgi:serine/threonine-protein kinase
MATFFAARLTKARDSAVAEAARTQRIQNFMTNLFQGGDPSAGPDENLRVVTLLDRGVQGAQSLRAEPEAQADLFETLGKLYENLGKLDQANSLLNSAFELQKSFYGADSSQAGEALVAIGLLRDDQAHLTDAEHLVREGLEIEKRHLPPNHPAVIRASRTLAPMMRL